MAVGVVCLVAASRCATNAAASFNQLDLPEYETEEELTERLHYAIRETAGFGFG